MRFTGRLVYGGDISPSYWVEPVDKYTPILKNCTVIAVKLYKTLHSERSGGPEFHATECVAIEVEFLQVCGNALEALLPGHRPLQGCVNDLIAWISDDAARIGVDAA